MKYLYSISFYFFIPLVVYSQQSANQSAEKQILQQHLQATVKILNINIANIQADKLSSLVSETDGWQEKIISVTTNTQTMIMSIEHNELWLAEEKTEMLEKYGISKSRIISDK